LVTLDNTVLEPAHLALTPSLYLWLNLEKPASVAETGGKLKRSADAHSLALQTGLAIKVGGITLKKASPTATLLHRM